MFLHISVFAFIYICLADFVIHGYRHIIFINIPSLFCYNFCLTIVSFVIKGIRVIVVG